MPRPCNWHYFLAAINATGSVSPCCGVQEAVHDFGTVADGSFRQVWHNPLYRGVRALYAGRSPANLADVEESVCASCPFPEDQRRGEEIIAGLLRSAPRKIQKRALQTLPPRWTRGLSVGARRERSRYHDARWNNLLLALQEQEAGVERPKSFPLALIIDPSSACSLRCPMCPVSFAEELRPKTTLDLDVFERLLEETGKYLFWVDLFNWGEPLLNKHLPDMVRRLARYELEVRISTSLSLPLSDAVLESLVDCGVDVLTVSIDGFTQETYEKYRVRGDVGLALANMSRLAAIKRARGATRPVIDWQYLVFSFNEHELDDARAFAAEVGAEFRPAAPFVDIDRHPDWLSRREEYVLDRYRAPASAAPPGAGAAADDWGRATNLDLTVGPCDPAFVAGFYQWENGRWMSATGTIRLYVPAGCSHVVVEGYAPKEVLRDGGQTLTLSSGAEGLGEITIRKAGVFARTIAVDAAGAQRLAGELAPLTLTASRTFVPAEISDSPDDRELSILLTRIGLQTAAPHSR